MSVLSFAKKQMVQTMLTAIPQIIKVRGSIRKWMKFLVLMLCLIGCSYQMWSFMEVYWTYPIIVDVFVSNPKVITAPAFTLCEYNGIRRIPFCARFPELCTPEKSIAEFCNLHFVYCKGIPNNVGKQKLPAIIPEELPSNFSNARDVYRSMGTVGPLFIDYVTFGNVLEYKEVSVFNLQNLPTNCFAYNTLWENSSAVAKTVHQRDAFDISVRLSGENFYSATPLSIQMVIHSPFMKVNPFTEGFSIQPCSTYNMYLTKTLKYLLPAPYQTNCTDYVKFWRHRNGSGPLNQEMCVNECVLNKSISKFGCFNPKLVTYPTENELFCFEEINDDFYSDCSRNCQPACFQEDVGVKMEEVIYSSSEANLDKETCVTDIRLSFVRTEVTTFTYSKKYQDVEAFGYIGGFLGMWLGLSLVAVCDFVETCIMILCYACKKIIRERKRQKNKMKINFTHKSQIWYA